MIKALDATLTHAAFSFGDELALVSSFGPTSMVILDRIARLDLAISVMTIDTGELFSETHELRRQVEARYNIKIQVVRAIAPTPQLWRADPDACCNERKVSPLKLALMGYDAYLTGLRRDQSSTRADQPMVSWDAANGLTKIAPLVEWTGADVWAYLRENNVPYNALHDQGYRSIGCTHCTRPSGSTDERAGRWAGTVKTECGLHRVAA